MKTLMLCAGLIVAGIAGAGEEWQLLIPPRSDYNEEARFLSGFKILADRPVTRWLLRDLFNSAVECEATRGDLTAAERREYASASEEYAAGVSAGASPVRLKAMRHLAEIYHAKTLALEAGRCIRNNDPRLGP